MKRNPDLWTPVLFSCVLDYSTLPLSSHLDKCCFTSTLKCDLELDSEAMIHG